MGLLNPIAEPEKIVDLELAEAIRRLPSETFLTELDALSRDQERADWIRARCLYDFELFCFFFFEAHCRYDFSMMHRDFMSRYTEIRRRVKEADAAPRGYAKTTIKALFKPIHDICYNLEKFILVISNTDDQAVGRTKDIRAELLENQALSELYGPFFKTKNPAQTDFVVDQGDHQTRVLGLGSGAEMRGIKKGAFRPTKIILDDAEHSEKIENPSFREKFQAWYDDVVGKLGDDEVNVEVIGTVIHKSGMLQGLVENPGYRGKIWKAVIEWDQAPELWEQWKRIYTDLTVSKDERDARATAFFEQNKAAMLTGTQVLWPEKQSYYHLMCELAEMGRRSFFKERQNDPRGDDEKLFNLDRLQYCRQDRDGIFFESQNRHVKYTELKFFGVLDPATGQEHKKSKKKPDYACLLTGAVDKFGYLYVIEDWTKREPPTRQINQIFEHHERWNYQKFGVETNLYRNLMMTDILEEKKRREKVRMDKEHPDPTIRIPFYDIVQTDGKVERIYTLEPKVTNGWIVFNRSLSKPFYDCLEAFPKGDHDDPPDALEMLYSLVNRRYEARAVGVNPQSR